MPRNFTKAIYGPYFPYDHFSKHNEMNNKEKNIEKKIEIFFNNLIHILTYKK